MNLLLTGKPGVGKTTVVRKVIAALTRHEPRIILGGFITEEIRHRKQRVGFQIITLDTHETALLSHVNIESPYRIGKYGISIEAMNGVAIPAILRAMQSASLVVVDEIGRMECFAPDFLQVINEALASDTPLFGVLQHRRLPFLDSIRDREDVEQIEVTERNRDSLPTQILEQLNANMSS